MAKLTRRELIKQASIGVAGAATIGALAAAPHLDMAIPAAHAATRQSAAVHSSGSMVVHVRNFSTGEISVMYGENEVVLHDPALVTRLLQTAR